MFFNLDADATPLAELVGDLPQRLERYRIPTLTPFAPGSGTQPANWKVIVDNYIEGYHIPIAHPGLMRMLDYKHYDVEVNEHYVWFEAPMRSKPSSNRLERLYADLVTPMPGLGPEDLRVWRYVFLYPNTTIDLYPDQVNTWQMVPHGVDRTHDVSAAFGLPATRAREPAGPVAQPAAQQPRPRRGHRPGRQRAAGAADPRLRVRAAVAARGRGRLVRRPCARGPGSRARCGDVSDKPSARERILAAAVRQIAEEGIDGVRIARIAMAAGVSTSLVHYHFDSRDALLAEALDYSYAHAGDARISSGELPASSHAERLQSMIDQCLPTSEALQDDWVLWVELWLRAVRNPDLRPVAEELYARLHAWFAGEIAAGVDSGEFGACDPDQVADLALALLDGYGIRTLIGDSAISIERARREVGAALAASLGVGEWLVGESAAQTGEPAPRAARAAARPVRTAPSM